MGGVVGSMVAPWLSRRAGPVWVLVGGSVVGGLARVGIGLTHSPWVAGGLLAVTGLLPVVYNVIFGSLRQQLIPDRLLGRVNSAYSLCTYGSVPLGALLGARWPTASASQHPSWPPASSSPPWGCWRFGG